MSKSKAFNENIGAFGWPPILPTATATAAAYCSVSKWTIKRAAGNGELAIAGHRGRSMTFRREDLDRWMVGEAGETSNRAAASPTRAALSRLGTLQRASRR